MIFDGIQKRPSASSPSSVREGLGAIAVLCLLLFAVWYYNFHIRHDPYFAVMWTSPLLVGLGFAVLETFFPSAYPSRLLGDSPQLKRLKRWRLGLILSAGGFLLAGCIRIAVTDASRFSNVFALPSYLCVCAWITLSVYITCRTSPRS
jgi:hypothetical protein